MKNKSYAKFGQGCLFVLMDRVSRSITVTDPGEGPGFPLIFGPNWGQKKTFSRPSPPPYLRAWMTIPPPYLRVWIRHWINSFLRDNCRKFPTGEICSQSENNIYFSLPTCESRHIILSVWRLGGDLIHFFTDFYNFLFAIFFSHPLFIIYTRFWNFLWEPGVKLVVCSLDSLSCQEPITCRIISRNWTKSGADVFQVCPIFFSRDYPRLILGWKGYFMSLFFHWSRGCCWKLPKTAWHCAFISETLRSKFFGIRTGTSSKTL